MSELNERQWSVISERGCEASSLTYEEASQLIRKLLNEKLSGLCVVTDSAANGLVINQKQSTNSTSVKS